MRHRAMTIAAAVLFAGAGVAGETKIGGGFDGKVTAKNITQVGVGIKVKQRISASSVECARVAGDFKGRTNAGNLTQVGVGLSVNQKISLRSVTGRGCN